MKKYKTIFDPRRRLYRIEALRDFGDVKEGQLGGFIAKEENLSHEGNCWIYGDAEVWGDACISENAKIHDQAKVYDYAKVYGDAQIYEGSKISYNAEVYGSAIVEGGSCIYDNAKVYGSAHIYMSYICGSAEIFGKAFVHYGPLIGGTTKVFGNAIVIGPVDTFGDALIEKRGDYLVFHKWWAEQFHYITWTRSNNKFQDGSFCGTAEEFLENGNKDSVIFNYAYKQIVEYVNKISEIEV